VVVGRNGSGKSSFADALEALLTGELRRWQKLSAVRVAWLSWAAGCRRGVGCSGVGGTVAAKEKLIRDRVPQIIRAQGDEPIVRIADPGEYRELLRAKLVEEAHKVATADDAHAPEELADVLEVVLALAADLGLDAGGLERLRAAKAVERGSFTERIVWCGNLRS
jgi:predicted house-cleaning noncanonical NTP pyrophosphatase (MazG superfamily)